MTTAIVQRQDLSMQKFQVIQSIAPVMKASRLFGVATDEQAAAVMIKGWELGFSLSASFEFIKPITAGGKTVPTLVPKGMMALILNSGECKKIDIKEEQDDKGAPFACSVTMERVNGLGHTVRFTMDDAQRAGLVRDGGAWISYPANMLRWRALGFCADIVFPDVIGGMKRSDEFGAAISEDGDIIDVETDYTILKPVPPAKPEITLQALLEEYSADQILSVNNGTIPGTTDEVAAVARKLTEGANE